MLRFFSKRGFSEMECFVFSAKGAFPKWDAPFSQKKGATAVKLHFLRKKKEALLAILARGTYWGGVCTMLQAPPYFVASLRSEKNYRIQRIFQ